MSGKTMKKVRQAYRRDISSMIREKPWWLPKFIYIKIIYRILYGPK